MIRARHVTHGQTAARVERLRLLITTLQVRQLMRDEIGEILQVGPSGVRKYLKDLGSMIAIARYVDGTPTYRGDPVYCLAMTSEQIHAYLANLDAAPAARPGSQSMSALSRAALDPSRHFHIMKDDTHYAIRLSRAPIVRDPLVAALFGPRSVEVRV
ncbi:ArsR family transcriptional regulator [Massilia sp. DD77]|uniref:ArsR family transcriptional regulator n=1 Tax=Massilia sp. DD77 TaxID=3109349 RepID=UPI002FFE420F